MTVNVLGQEYSVEYSTIKEQPKLKDCDGYSDSSTHKCVIDRMDKTDDPRQKEDIRLYRDSVVRHELIHAFLNESGLDTCSWAKNEEMVDWMAIQLPKMVKAMKSIDVL
ncbi:hypothetical protein [Clostridium sp. KNHs216]|uniref:hypothetical protein n=1 Tax=Clostridium sp. KNHs216 TaxID=1550235 RepID=UPI001154A2B5|nr:hypothetical protein [Clostridium sp. KNHs216]TQI66255.1 hypothetical protein LY85_0916 [Clostridium sp. KNHs216]